MKTLKGIVEGYNIGINSSTFVQKLEKFAGSIYTVKPGDIVSKICKGDPQWIKAVFDANPGLEDRTLRLGEKIILPDRPVGINKSKSSSSWTRDFLKKEEGLRLKVYTKDGSKNGVRTIGYGHTGFDKSITEIDLATAERFLTEDILVAEGFIGRNIDMDLNQNQFDALTSTMFNVGIGGMFESDLYNAINSKNLQLIYSIYPTFNTSNGKGLVNRRMKEYKRFRG